MFLIIHNPLSNNRKSKKTTSKMVKFFQKQNIPFILRSTLKIQNLNTLLDKNDQITDILYLGGDGSINYLINNVDLTKIKQNIYLSKSGSGNDFLRTLKKIKTGNISIGEAKTNTKTTKFINGCGVGIDALVCHYVNNDTKRNKLSYFVNVFRSVINFKRTELEVTVDGKEYKFKHAYFIAIQNGKYFGGGMRITPKANPTDDTYRICVAYNLNNFIIQLLFISVYLGWHKYIKKRIKLLEGKEIQIKISNDNYFQADGEVIENVNNISVKKLQSHTFHAFCKKDFKNYKK
jgi:diacylglycerol kinase (ATP)